jgi:coproporphyrinogen III oxidase
MATPARHHTPDMADRAVAYFTDLQNRICTRFEQLDGTGTFVKTPWQKEPGDLMQGGGEMRVMRGGKVFEKVGVNFSCVHGRFSDEFAPNIPGASIDNPQFWASGVSLVAHMQSPLVPAVHMNVRRIATTKSWFGGGADLTPYYPFAEDTDSFHAHLKAACDGYRDGAYTEYKAWCDRYFFLPHRNEPRGVGGIFFDNLDSGNEEADFAFVQSVGEAFLTAYTQIVSRRKDLPWTAEQREHQLIRRGRYVEFNLLYDRGTLFGLKTNGNTDAILMSMPPEVKWP